MTASYLKLYQSGELAKRVEQAYEILADCSLCPHNCQVDRTEDEIGYCKTGSEIRIASFGPHYGEEAPLVGSNGSGTIFFSNCNLRCVYCQNYDISQEAVGDIVSVDELAEIMLSLQERSCHNINFVTPSHMIHALLEATLIAAKQGLEIPLVYNSGGYDSLESLQLLDGVIDIYMPDIKYFAEDKALKYSQVDGYKKVVKTAIKEMQNQVGTLKIKKGLATKGLLIRHLVLPNNIANSKEIIDFIAEEIAADTYLNIMGQYYPAYQAKDYDKLQQRVKEKKLRSLIKYAKNKGLTRV